MGCKNTKTNEEKLFNEDVDIKRRFLPGIPFSKGAEGLEGNVQIALATTRKKKYERVVGTSQVNAEEEEDQNT